MADQLTIVSFRYNEAPPVNKNNIKALLYKVWNIDDNEEIHPKDYDAMSFCSYLHKQMVGYAGIIFLDVKVKDNLYKLGALSCVCTHPEYQRQGIGSRTIHAATEWIINKSQVDIGFFTCYRQHAAFYERSGIWTRDNSVILKGSPREDALSSHHLQLAVIKALFSEKSRLNASDFTNTTIVLNLPENQFI